MGTSQIRHIKNCFSLRHKYDLQYFSRKDRLLVVALLAVVLVLVVIIVVRLWFRIHIKVHSDFYVIV